ncbi:hypothetical protein BC831DRAFT_296015 [Entophlyctis helioformis]|nr:hypothetical protein BC831DRAFT_296015 [Entophlyctis helioformis]
MTTQPTLPRQSKTGSANAATAATANTGSGRGLDVPVHASEPAKAARPAKAAVGAQSARSLPQTMQPASPAACAQSESVASCVAAHRASASFDGENDSSGAALWPRPPPALPLREHNKALVHTDASSAAGSNHHHNCGPSARAPACLVAQSQQPGQQPGQSDVCSPDLRCACPNSTETRSATATVPSTRRSTSSSSSSSSSSSTTSSRAATFKPATVAPAAASPSAPAPAPSPAARPPAEQTAPRSTRIPAMPQQHSGLLLSDDNHRMPSSAFTPVASCSVLGRAALVPHGGPSKRLQLKPPLQQTSPPPEPAATQPLLLNQPPARDPDGPDSPDGHLAAYRETGASHRGCSAPLAPERLAPTPAQTPAPDASAIPADACSSQHPACPPADTDPDTAMRSSCQEETVARSVAEFQTTADATVAAAGLTATATATATTTLAANMATATARSTPLLSLGLISLSEPNTAAQHSSRPVATPFSPKQRRARRLSGYSNACSQAEFSVQTTLPTATMAAGSGLDDNNGVLKRPLAISATAHVRSRPLSNTRHDQDSHRRDKEAAPESR